VFCGGLEYLVAGWVSMPSLVPGALVLSCLPGVGGATRTAVSADAGTPAGAVAVRSSDLLVRGYQTRQPCPGQGKDPHRRTMKIS